MDKTIIIPPGLVSDTTDTEIIIPAELNNETFLVAQPTNNATYNAGGPALNNVTYPVIQPNNLTYSIPNMPNVFDNTYKVDSLGILGDTTLADSYFDTIAYDDDFESLGVLTGVDMDNTDLLCAFATEPIRRKLFASSVKHSGGGPLEINVRFAPEVSKQTAVIGAPRTNVIDTCMNYFRKLEESEMICVSEFAGTFNSFRKELLANAVGSSGFQ